MTITRLATRLDVQELRVRLKDGVETTVHALRYDRGTVRPKVVLFDKETKLTDYCQQNNITEAIGGGFFLREVHKPLGDLWINGFKQSTVSFSEPWATKRGSIYINKAGKAKITFRHLLPQKPAGDLIQAGPLLLQNSRSMIAAGKDTEGFSAGSNQFDSDITIGRYPRAAIGLDKNHLWLVVCDGRSKDEAGLSLKEFADVLREIGVEDALNLDGGSSSSLVSGSKLINKPRSDDRLFRQGRPIYSAIVLESS
jgi:hypothetical protein